MFRTDSYPSSLDLSQVNSFPLNLVAREYNHTAAQPFRDVGAMPLSIEKLFFLLPFRSSKSVPLLLGCSQRLLLSVLAVVLKNTFCSRTLVCFYSLKQSHIQAMNLSTQVLSFLLMSITLRKFTCVIGKSSASCSKFVSVILFSSRLYRYKWIVCSSFLVG